MSGLTYQDFQLRHWSLLLAQIVDLLSSMQIKSVFKILEHQGDSCSAHNKDIQSHTLSHLQKEESVHIVVLSFVPDP